MKSEHPSIVVGVDLTAARIRVVEAAAALAGPLGATLWLIHVAAPDPDFVGLDAGPQTVRDARAAELHEEHRDLQDLAASLRERGLSATALLVQGPTAGALVDEAERRRATLIVLGTRGHGLLGKALLGSVGEGVLRKSRVPVVIVPLQKEEG
jgi:nucleotide-binding universal stress UspA family protein